MKDVAQITVSILLTIGVLIFTAMELLPIEAFISFASVAVTWTFKEIEKQREIQRLLKKEVWDAVPWQITRKD